MSSRLVDGHGNFGSVDNDPPAAMRYTEARLTKFAAAALLNSSDLGKADPGAPRNGGVSVDLLENFDGSEWEPDVLPARAPVLLINGAAGIAVGMATSIPPHNLGEVCDAALLAARFRRGDVASRRDVVASPRDVVAARLLKRGWRRCQHEARLVSQRRPAGARGAKERAGRRGRLAQGAPRAGLPHGRPHHGRDGRREGVRRRRRAMEIAGRLSRGRETLRRGCSAETGRAAAHDVDTSVGIRATPTRIVSAETGRFRRRRDYVGDPRASAPGSKRPKKSVSRSRRYASGSGSIVVRGKTSVEKVRSGRMAIIATELPYQVCKSDLLEKTAEAVNAKRLTGIADLRDESDRDGMRIVYELKRDANPSVVLSNLFKSTRLQTSFAANMVALRAGNQTAPVPSRCIFFMRSVERAGS